MDILLKPYQVVLAGISIICGIAIGIFINVMFIIV